MDIQKLEHDTDSLNIPSYLEEIFISVIEQLELLKKYSGVNLK